MMADDKTPAPASSPKQRARRLRIAGIVVLALGIAGACVVYWLGTRSQDVSGDLSMVGFDHAERRQMAILYGKQGQLIEEWTDDLQQPGTQAVIISILSVIVASCCFYFARLSDMDE